MRLIDADALIDKTDDRYSLREIGRRERDDIVDALEYAPTIQPEPHWIPCEERLPDVGIDGEIEILGYEQLAIADNNIYIIFESASMKYFEGTDGNGTSTAPIDKVLEVTVASVW